MAGGREKDELAGETDVVTSRGLLSRDKFTLVLYNKQTKSMKNKIQSPSILPHSRTQGLKCPQSYPLCQGKFLGKTEAILEDVYQEVT